MPSRWGSPDHWVLEWRQYRAQDYTPPPQSGDGPRDVKHGRIRRPHRRRYIDVSWLWKADDLDLRVSFARTNGPVDFLTLFVRYVLTNVIPPLTLVLRPIDIIMQFVGRGLIAVVLGMLLLIVIHGVWMFFWLPLMGTSWLWLRYGALRPVLLLPGIVLAIIAHIFLLLVPDPHKNPKYNLMAQEWPISWHLWKPTQAYFDANPLV